MFLQSLNRFHLDPSASLICMFVSGFEESTCTGLEAEAVPEEAEAFVITFGAGLKTEDIDYNKVNTETLI